LYFFLKSHLAIVIIIFIASGFVIAGTGLIFLKETMRKWTLTNMWLLLIIPNIYIIIFIYEYFHQLGWNVFIYFGILIYPIGTIIYPIGTIIYLTRPNVKEQFK